MIDEHEAEQSGTGEQQGATGNAGVLDADGAELSLPPAELITTYELDKAEDIGLGEAERALLQWAMRQRQRAPGEPLLPTTSPTPAATPPPAPEPAPPAPPAPAPTASPMPEEEASRPWELFHGSAEEAISALVAAGGPDPRDYASPRLDRRAKLLIALVMVLLFVVSAVGGFVGYRLTHRADGGGAEAVGRLAGVHAGPATPAAPGV
jgi:hypothetical protein